MKPCYLALIILLATSFGASTSGAIAELECEDLGERPLSTDRWSFDYASQTLFLTQELYGVYEDPENTYDFANGIWIVGRHETPLQRDTLTVVLTVANAGAVPWTSVVMKFDGTIVTGAAFVGGNAENSAFSEVTYSYFLDRVTFSGEGMVMPDKTLTMRFDVWVRGENPYHGNFRALLTCQPVPEPGSVLLMAFGSVALCHRRNRRRDRDR